MLKVALLIYDCTQFGGAERVALNMANEFTPIVDTRDEFERKEKIKQLQKYLREIAKVDNRIPLLVIDGFFLDETENAVRIFQEISPWMKLQHIAW